MVWWCRGEESVFDLILYLVVSAKSQLLGLFGPLPQTLKMALGGLKKMLKVLCFKGKVSSSLIPRSINYRPIENL